MTGAIPVLETERLTLRGPESRDVDAFEAFFTSERAGFVARRIGPGEGWRVLAIHIGQWALNGFGSWVVTWKGEDRAIGCIGGWRPADWPENEIGWTLFAGAEGRSVGFEAARVARDCLYRRFGWTTAVSYVDPENARSARLAERLGCVRDDTAPRTERLSDCLIFRHPAPERAA